MLATAGCLALAHCSSDDSAAGPTNGDDAGGGGDNDATAITDTGTGPNDAAIVDAAPAIVDVNGTLHDVNRNVAAGGKVVHVLDADGTLTTVTADANGKFQVKGVKTPYDVYVPIVYADGGEVGATGDYVVGITRDDPWISTSDITVAHHATYSITTTICSGCVFYYGFPSFGAKSANGTGASQTIDESVTWLGPATMSVDVTQLVKDATGTWITYGIGSRSFTDGATTSTPVASLGDALGANTNLTVTSTGPATYTAGGANVDLANEAGNRVGEASSPAGALKLP
ncbi:MAG TPA: hypothetical protein VF407_16280, partial [Polyangiaceae bacterium]